MSSPKDEVNVGPEVAPGVRVAVRRDETGERVVTLRKAVDGAPMGPTTELVEVDPECRGGWHSVRSIYRGPPQVATDAYREGYDRIFGGRQTVGAA